MDNYYVVCGNYHYFRLPLLQVNILQIMAKAIQASVFKPKAKKSNKGVHAKTKVSKAKGSKNYKKPYVGQGK